MIDYKKLIKDNFLGINDSTLREGEQFNASEFTLKDQIEILKLQSEIGVDTVEVGNPIVSEIRKDVLVLGRIKDRPLMMCHIRNRADDLKAVLGLGVEGVHILCTVDPTRLESMHLSLEAHIEIMLSNIAMAKEGGLIVRVSVEHGLEERFLVDAMKILKTAENLKVDRVQIADTRGVLLPWEIGEIIKKLRTEIKVPIGVHLHNDLGHSVINALEALGYGANWVDTSLLGIGERSGITPLSSLLVNLKGVGIEKIERYDLESLTRAETDMARIIGISVPHNLITSKTAFSHKAGVHINGLIKQGSETYEAINPDVVGNTRILVTNSRISGKSKNMKSYKFESVVAP
ncbi:MAG: LeuA family protein [bacterium]|nr:LeuA family protein [bacterium]